ncbi:PHP domain-containing protein [Faecalicoccus pleomorphus]|uniref:PHP domain-containing protein n=1 Tax=Faecalicoccus TaxID=1573536 RepID=UPI00189A6914|nr:PHP domain-containing protein [Faecalicoccus pleomorphus]MDB7984135.1 PHP domain-containing protein [Faecalicoccus pleomorphus]
MVIKEYSLKDLTTAYFQKKSQLYRSGGYRHAKYLRRNFEDYQAHFFAFLMDINVCLLPVYIWVIEFLLILCGLIPPNFFDLLFYIMYALLFVVSVLLLPIFSARCKGQSIGYVFTDLKLVKKNKEEASALKVIFRQMVGFGIPLMVFGFFFQTFGIVLWWLVNGLVALLTPCQQTLVDLFFNTVTVREPITNIRFEQEVKEEIKADVTPIDLHIRSNYSDDASNDVEEIFKEAKQLGMETISITDHNCARANAAASRFAPLYGIQYIPGVEIDAQYRSTRIRILGYYIDWSHEIFDDLERESLMREKKMSIERVQRFEKLAKVKIDTRSIMENSRFQTITPTDITNMVFNNAQVRSMPLVKKYVDAYEPKEAMRRFRKDVFGKNGPCYVHCTYPAAKEIIQAIHEAGGIAILASWHLDSISDDLIEEIMRLGMDGIECFSPDIREETMASAIRIAQKYKAFISCGSDYHGTTKPDRHLGVTNCPAKALPLVRILTKAA